MSDLPPPLPPPPPGAFSAPGYAPRLQREWAGFWIRLGALLIDSLILAIPNNILRNAFIDDPGLEIFVGVGGGGSRQFHPGVALVTTLIALAYFALQEGSPSGQTLGKRVCGLRVVDVDNGASIGLGRAAGRNLGSIISSIPCALGYFWMLWDDQRQTWHDKMVRSNVVKE